MDRGISQKAGDYSSQVGIVHGDVTIYQGPSYSRLNYQSEIAGILDYYTQAYVASDQEVQDIIRFIQSAEPGYLLINAPAGFGKTALIANLIKNYESGAWFSEQDLTLLYFFIRQEGGRNTPQAFLQAINSQLLNNLNLPGGVPIDISALRAQFSHLWDRALSHTESSRPLGMIVDGLDEIREGEIHIAHLLPASLQPYVHILVTSRPNPDPLERVDFTHPFRKTKVSYLSAFNPQRIQALLNRFNPGFEISPDLSGRILKITKGEPLYAHFVAQAVAAGGSQVLDQLESSPPVGVQEYFRQQFKQLDKAIDGDLSWEILSLFGATLGPVTLHEIAEVLGNSSQRQIRKAIEPIRRFLLGDHSLALIHSQLHQALVDELGQKELAVYRQKLLGWGDSYRDQGWPENTPEYLLKFYADHLFLEGRSEDLFGLINPHWMQLLFNCTFSHRLFRQTIDLCIRAARRSGLVNLVQEIRCRLIAATLSSMASETPLELLEVMTQVGWFERAADQAAMMSQDQQWEGYLVLAESLFADGDRVRGRDMILQALESADRLDESSWNIDRKLNALSRLAPALVRHQEMDSLFASGEALGRAQLPEPGRRSRQKFLALAARSLIEAGEKNAAHEALLRLEKSLFRPGCDDLRLLLELAQAYADLAENSRVVEISEESEGIARSGCKPDYLALHSAAITLAAAGKSIPALDLCAAIEPRSTLIDAYIKVAFQLLKQGQQEEASLIAGWLMKDFQNPESIRQLDTYQEFIDLLVQMEDTEKLLLSLATLHQENLFDEAHAAVLACAFSKLGNLAKAQTITGQIHTAEALADAWNCLGPALIQRRRFAGLNRFLKTLGHSQAEDSIRLTLASSLADQHELERALDLIHTISTPKARAVGFAKAAKTFVAIGQVETAKKLVSEAVSISSISGDDPSVEIRFKCQYGHALLHSGQTQKGRQVLDRAYQQAIRFAPSEDSNPDFWGIFDSYLDLRDFDRARSVLGRLYPSGAEKSNAILRLAEALAQSGFQEAASQELDRAQASLGQKDDPAARSFFLCKLIRIAATLGKENLAARANSQVEMLTGILDDQWNNKRIHDRLLDFWGDEEKVVAWIRQGWLRDDWKRVQFLIQLGLAWAEGGYPHRAVEPLELAQKMMGAVIADLHTRETHLGLLADAFAAAGEVERAISILNQIESGEERVGTLCRLAGRFSSAELSTDMLHQALEGLDNLRSEEMKAEALSRVSLAYARLGRESEASETAQKALAQAAHIEDLASYSLSFYYLSESFFLINRPDLAFNAWWVQLNLAKTTSRINLKLILGDGAICIAKAFGGEKVCEIYQALQDTETLFSG